MAGSAHPGGVPGTAPGGHGGALDRRIHRHHGRGRVPLPGVRRGTVPVEGEVRVPLRVAELLPALQRRRGGADRGPLAGHDQDRSPVCPLRLPPRPRVRGRGLSGAHRPALVHQLRLAHAGTGGRRMTLRLIRAGQLSGDTAQTNGMTRAAAISGPLTGSQSLWMGTTVMAPATSSGDHHHGASETGIYVVSGHPAFVFRGPGGSGLTRLEAGPGDFVWVPPHVPHREEIASPDTEAVVVIARSTQEAIVVSVDAL